jgi:hypothetical protein
VQPLHVVGDCTRGLSRSHEDIHNIGGRVDYWSSGNACGGVDAALQPADGAGDYVNAVGRIGKIQRPQYRWAQPVRVEGKNAVSLGGYIENIVRALSGNGDVGHIQGLPVDLIVNRVREQFAEGFGSDICGRKGGFVEILPGTAEIVMLGESAGVSLR